MSISQAHYSTFKKGSTTYFNSSLFFPDHVREDVFTLYGFVRVADNFVDATPQDGAGFHAFCDRFRSARAGDPSGDPIVDSFVALMDKRQFDPSWVEAFLASMEMDLTKATYERLEETLLYIYGSAEVIGLFMARILDLPDESHSCAQLQGRSMQYMNFVRDIAEDLALGRRYLPIENTPLQELSRGHAENYPDEFRAFMDYHIRLYRHWQSEAEEGYAYIPKRYLVPIKTASDMYAWTASTIRHTPSVVFDRKVKPSKPRVMLNILKNAISLSGRA